MKEVLITSSILILAVMVLRLVFRGKVSQKLIYGAWLLVALRLLVPVQFGSFDFSILNQAEPVTEVITEVSKNPVAGPSREEVYQQIAQDYIDRGEHIFIPEVEEKLESGEVPSYEEVFQNYPIQSIVIPEVNTQIQQEVEKSITAPTVGQIATAVWITGMVAMALWFGLVNLRFHRALAKTAKPMEVPDSPVPVMVDDTVASPCLFGFFRPKVYLTPVCTKDETHLRHVLTHELTHYAHKDHIWSLVRCVCLCVYWFNPLVWIAAGLAKRDCELACDEAVLKKLGDEERISYGKTLVDMVANSSSPAHYLETATAMHESKEQLAERIGRIICKPKFLIAAAVALVVVLAVVAGFVFAGPASHTDDPPAITAPTTPPPTTTAPPSTTLPPTVPPTTSEPPVTSEPVYQFRPEGVPVDDATLQALTEMVDDTDNWYYRFSAWEFWEPKYVNIGTSFFQAFGSAQLTPEEIQFLQYTSYGKYIGYLDAFRYPIDEIDAVMRQYLGISLAESDKNGLPSVYWDETRCYYNFGGGPHNKMFVHSAYTLPYGTICLYYVPSNFPIEGDFMPSHVMVLHPTDTGYRILANQKVENFQPDPETYAKYLFPDIPAAPDSVDGADFVYTLYQKSVIWQDPNRNRSTVSIRLPALNSDTEGAKAINADIYRRASNDLNGLRNDYREAYSPSFASLDYETWQVGNIFTLSIIWTAPDGYQTQHDYYLDLSSGKWLTDTDLTGLSYVEMLYRQCSNLPEHTNDKFADACGLSARRYLDRNGMLWLRHTCVSADAKTVQIPFDLQAGELSSAADIYHWFFNIRSDGHLSETLSVHTVKAFADDPLLFTQCLSAESADKISEVARRVAYSLNVDQFAGYISQCRHMIGTGTEDVKHTAQILLDSMMEYHSLSKWDDVSAVFAKIVDADTAKAHGKELYDLFSGSTTSFPWYMSMMDSRYYDDYCQAFLAHATTTEKQQLMKYCQSQATDPYTYGNTKLAAQALLRALGYVS